MSYPSQVGRAFAASILGYFTPFALFMTLMSAFGGILVFFAIALLVVAAKFAYRLIIGKAPKQPDKYDLGFDTSNLTMLRLEHQLRAMSALVGYLDGILSFFCLYVVAPIFIWHISDSSVLNLELARYTVPILFLGIIVTLVAIWQLNKHSQTQEWNNEAVDVKKVRSSLILITSIASIILLMLGVGVALIGFSLRSANEDKQVAKQAAFFNSVNFIDTTITYDANASTPGSDKNVYTYSFTQPEIWGEAKAGLRREGKTITFSNKNYHSPMIVLFDGEPVHLKDMGGGGPGSYNEYKMIHEGMLSDTGMRYRIYLVISANHSICKLNTKYYKDPYKTSDAPYDCDISLVDHLYEKLAGTLKITKTGL